MGSRRLGRGRWWTGNADTSVLTTLGSYRFDDPGGEVGTETHLLTAADGQVLQVPLTYRGNPGVGAEDSLITTMTPTTLGHRWIHDGCHDLSGTWAGQEQFRVLMAVDVPPRS